MFRFGGLITKNALRNQRRTTLTILSIAISIFLVSTLQAVLASIDGGGKEAIRRVGTWTHTAAYNVPRGKAVEVCSEDDFLTALVGQSVSPGPHARHNARGCWWLAC
jgi:hypothetical protein